MKKPKSLQFLAAMLLCTFGCLLLIAGFIAPPIGNIDSSLLIAYGETLTFAGSVIGIDYHYTHKP